LGKAYTYLRMWIVLLAFASLCLHCNSVRIELEKGRRGEEMQTHTEGDGYDGPGEQEGDQEEDEEDESSVPRQRHVHEIRPTTVDRAQIEAKLSKLTEVLSQLQNPTPGPAALAATIQPQAQPLTPRLAVVPVHSAHFHPKRLTQGQVTDGITEKVAMSANFVESSPPATQVGMVRPVARVVEARIVPVAHEEEDDRGTDRSIRSALRVIDSSKHSALASRLQKELKHTSDNTNVLLDVAKKFRTASKSLDEVTEDIDRLSEGIA